jgi:hypothetical protein
MTQVAKKWKPGDGNLRAQDLACGRHLLNDDWFLSLHRQQSGGEGNTRLRSQVARALDK